MCFVCRAADPLGYKSEEPETYVDPVTEYLSSIKELHHGESTLDAIQRIIRERDLSDEMKELNRS